MIQAYRLKIIPPKQTGMAASIVSHVLKVHLVKPVFKFQDLSAEQAWGHGVWTATENAAACEVNILLGFYAIY